MLHDLAGRQGFPASASSRLLLGHEFLSNSLGLRRLSNPGEDDAPASSLKMDAVTLIGGEEMSMRSHFEDSHHDTRAVGRACLIALLCVVAGSGVFGASLAATSKLVAMEDYRTPGLEPELAGFCPHPTDDSLYFVAANAHPNYKPGQRPLLPVENRGKLLTVNRHTGAIVRTVDLVGGDYGGVAYGEGHLFVSSLRPPEILKIHPESGKIVDRIAMSGPAGGLEYDKERSVLLAQLYISFPHLAVVDPKGGATVATLWSDESAMDLAKVDGDLLCTWVSGFKENAFSELRLINQETGRVDGRIRLDQVHTIMKPLDKKVAGVDGFISLVSTDRKSGKVVIRKYAYNRGAIKW